MSKEQDYVSTKDFLVGTVIGATIGAGLALLFAPKSGRELRGDISVGAQKAVTKANEWKETAQVKGIELKDKAVLASSDLKEKATKKTNELTQAVTTKSKELKNAATTKVQNLQSKGKGNEAMEEIEDQVEKVAEKIDQVAKEIEDDNVEKEQ